MAEVIDEDLDLIPLKINRTSHVYSYLFWIMCHGWLNLFFAIGTETVLTLLQSQMQGGLISLPDRVELKSKFNSLSDPSSGYVLQFSFKTQDPLNPLRGSSARLSTEVPICSIRKQGVDKNRNNLFSSTVLFACLLMADNPGVWSSVMRMQMSKIT